VSDFIYGPDLDAIRAVNATGPLPYVLKNITMQDFDQTAVSRLSAVAQRITSPSELDAMIRTCAVRLSVEYLPEVFIAESNQQNAFTFGSDKHAFMVVDSTLLKRLTNLELSAVIAHELGHIKSGHMLYHTLAQVLGGGLSLSASLIGLSLISIPVRLALLSWQRESEVTADRAGLLAVNDIEVIRSLLTKTGHGQGEAVDKLQTKSQLLDSASELIRTHPLDAKRYRFVNEFWQSDGFLGAERKIQRRARILKGLIPICRFCMASKPVDDLFCPKCGKCQT
jgi:Zn-dependent protease with chaperone function